MEKIHGENTWKHACFVVSIHVTCKHKNMHVSMYFLHLVLTLLGTRLHLHTSLVPRAFWQSKRSESLAIHHKETVSIQLC